MLQTPQTWPLLCTLLLSPHVPSRQGEAPGDEIIRGDGHREQPALWHKAQEPAWADYLCSSLAVRDETCSPEPCCSLRGFSSLPKWGGPNPERADCPPHVPPANPSCRRALSILLMKRSRRNRSSAFTQHLSMFLPQAGAAQSSLPPWGAMNPHNYPSFTEPLVH